MRLPSLLLALIAVACTPTAALAQKTMPNLAVGAPVLAAAEKAAGATTTAPKSIADYNTRYLALPGLVAAALEKARAAVVAPPKRTDAAGGSR